MSLALWDVGWQELLAWDEPAPFLRLELNVLNAFEPTGASVAIGDLRIEASSNGRNP